MRQLSIATLLLALALCSCAGARHPVRFDTAEVPVSLSRSVLDEDGQILSLARQQVVGRFEGEFSGSSIFWTLARMSSLDLSEALNARVRELGGDAVVRLRCRTGPKQSNLSNWVLWINMLPFWPGRVTVEVDADIVKVVPRDT
jgi:hypothetical protein